MSLALGIDLGTTNSCAAVMEHDAPMVVPLQGGKLTLPSVVAFAEDNQRLVGEAAKRQFVNNVARTIFAAKRLIGRSFDDPQTRKAMESMSYRCVKGPNGDVWVDLGDRQLAIQEISAHILSEIKRAARHHFAQEINEAVITVPAYFNDRQRHATKQAAQIAGLEVLRIINEPTAAALAYGMHQGAERCVAVYDLGGGTFDVSILRVGGGAVEVLASDGDAFLGGHDFDNRIYKWLSEQIKKQHNVNVQEDLRASQRLREASENAKIRLSDDDTAKIGLPFLATLPNGESMHFETNLSRGVYESLISDLVDRTIVTFKSTIAAAGLTPDKVDEVLLVGGMTCTPIVRQSVQTVIASPPATGVHPDLAVAVGAAVQASLLDAESNAAVLLDVTPHNLGIMTVADLAETIIPKNTKVPASVRRRFVTIKDNQSQVKVVVFQGDERHIDKNEILGEFRLEGIRAARAGDVQIDVTFAISVDGMVEVTATDVETGHNQVIRISGAVGITEQDLERMIEDHQSNLPDDGLAPSPT